MKRKLRQKIKITEADVRKQVRDYLRLKGWFVFHLLQGLGSYRGLTDLIAVKSGRVVFIEIKKRGGKQSSWQKEFQEDIETHGGEYWLIDCWEDIIKMVGGE